MYYIYIKDVKYFINAKKRRKLYRNYVECGVYVTLRVKAVKEYDWKT